jgi:hypothetical protein
MRSPSRRLQSARSLLGVLGGVFLAMATGCGFGDAPLGAVDPDAAPLAPTYEQAKTILDRNCAPCHKEGGGEGGGDLWADRGSALLARPGDRIAAEPDYSTCQGIQGGLDGIVRTVLQGGSMPPGAWPRLSEEDKLTLQRWLDQGACSPCSPRACP